MKIGDQVEGGIYAGSVDGHHIICPPNEYELPFEVDWFQATAYCKSIGMELPTKEELNLLYELYKLKPEYFPKLKYQWYWSSTGSSTSSVWIHNFGYGNQYTGYRASNFYVRPIKRIKV